MNPECHLDDKTYMDLVSIPVLATTCNPLADGYP